MLALILIPLIVSRFLTQVEAGTIRLVSSLNGRTAIYKGPGKAIEVPLMTTGTTIPSKAINIDLDIADQTADVDGQGQPKPIKVRVLASAIVSVGDLQRDDYDRCQQVLFQAARRADRDSERSSDIDRTPGREPLKPRRAFLGQKPSGTSPHSPPARTSPNRSPPFLWKKTTAWR